MHRLPFPALLGGLAVALILSSCGPSRGEFGSLEPGAASGERYRSGLEVPPDLADTSSDTIVANSARESGQSQQKVLPEIENLDIERNNDEGWIEVNADADIVWQRLVDHWGSLGVQLVKSNPTTGTMETDWVLPDGTGDTPPTGALDDLLNRLLGGIFDQAKALDKYTLQLERLGENRTRINVSHRGMEKVQTQKPTKQYNAEYDWVETGEQPEKVQRVLTSIAYGLRGKTT